MNKIGLGLIILFVNSQSILGAEIRRSGFSSFLDVVMPIFVLVGFGFMLYKPLKEPIDKFFGAIWELVKKIFGGDDEPPGPGEGEYTYEPYYR